MLWNHSLGCSSLPDSFNYLQNDPEFIKAGVNVTVIDLHRGRTYLIASGMYSET